MTIYLHVGVLHYRADVTRSDTPWGSKHIFCNVGVFKSLQIRRACRGVLSLLIHMIYRVVLYPLWSYSCVKSMHISRSIREAFHSQKCSFGHHYLTRFSNLYCCPETCVYAERRGGGGPVLQHSQDLKFLHPHTIFLQLV